MEPTPRRKRRTRRRNVIIASALVSGLFFVLFAFALWPYDIWPFSSWTFGVIVLVCGLAGFFRGGTDPLFFELAAELTHPRAAGLGGSVLTFFYHLLLVASLSVPASALNKWTTTLMFASMGVCIFLLLPLRIRYVRRLET